ncbi:MAG: lipid A 3-O-deacylase [Oceanospirillaceae bacterium]|jgi:lipid A 3-O-deacylase
MFKFVTTLLFSCFTCLAQSADDPWTLNLHFENDLFANTDLNYTNGVRVSWVSADLENFLQNQQNNYVWINRVNQLLVPLHPTLLPSNKTGEEVHKNIVFSVGQLMFTPQDKTKTTLDNNDRPYAGWLYSGIGYQARTKSKLHSFELNVGIVGPAALAKESQDFIHNIRDIERFNGWDNQLSNELGVQLVFERKRRFKPFKKNAVGGFDSGFLGAKRLESDFITHWGASLGNVATYVNAGAEWRIGWSLPSDFGTSTLKPGGDSNNPGTGDPNKRILQVHGFAAVDGRLVARNIFLDGNTFTDSHSVNKKKLVADMTIGVSVVYRRWNVSYSHVYRTKEFNAQSASQKYGSLSMSYSY